MRKPCGLCGNDEAQLYPCGWRCLWDSPATVAGRVVPVPDPACTLEALRAKASKDYVFIPNANAVVEERTRRRG